jgi:hemerythrin-like domain-containing protein
MIQIRTGGTEAESTTLDAPLEHLMACHRRIEERLSTLERAGAALQSRRDEALRAIRSAFGFMDSNGAIHTRDEEESLFPRLQGRITEAETALVAALKADHEEAERIYLKLREIVDRIEAGEMGFVPEYAETAAALCKLYRRHIEAEDSRLMEAARRGLSGEDMAEISGEMKVRRGLA